METGQFSFAENNGGIVLPDGFQAVVVAEEVVDSVGEARYITVNDNGDVYVALRRTENRPGVAALRDTTGDGVADRLEYFGDYTGTGIGLHNGFLYIAPDTAVVRYSMENADLVPQSEPEVVLSGLPEQSGHASKPFTFDNQGNLYINVGAPSNACQEESRTPGSRGQDPCPDLERQAGIWQFDADEVNQTQQEDGVRYATGIRNSGGITWNSEHSQLYSVQHGRDQLHTLWPDIYTSEQSAELPAEEFFKINEGDNFGWPYTYYDHQKGQKMTNPEYGGDGETPAPEGEYKDPIAAFPGHWAPNNLIFYSGDQFPDRYKNGAFIAFHGSWNRAPHPQEGYKVVFVPFDGDEPVSSSDYEVFADGFAGTSSLRSPGDADYRPMGLAEGPDGSLYISDSTQGKLWRIIYTGN
ncbi:MAG: PQQ-dependent sugar dehydrogenase [Balneolaceae bacterium]